VKIRTPFVEMRGCELPVLAAHKKERRKGQEVDGKNKG
jgi:hypothetical protein